MDYFDDIMIPYAGKVGDGHCRTHVPLYYGIQYNESGQVRLRIGDGEERLFSGAFVFITHPGTEFSYCLDPSRKHNYHAVCFTGKRVEHYLKSGLLSLEPEIYPVQDTRVFRTTILELISERNSGRKGFSILLLEKLLLLLHGSGNRSALSVVTPWQTNALIQLAEKIRQHVNENWDFDREAEKMNVSTRHFRSIFAQVNHLPPQHFLLHERMVRAAEELVTTRDTIKMIAVRCGFQDEFYFSRVFRKSFLLSPGKYRREFQGPGKIGFCF